MEGNFIYLNIVKRRQAYFNQIPQKNSKFNLIKMKFDSVLNKYIRNYEIPYRVSLLITNLLKNLKINFGSHIPTINGK